MTRKEEIKRAAINRADKHEFNEAKRHFGLLNLNSYSYNSIWKTEIESFIVGAELADENPKSPWISVKDDLPCNHIDLMENENYTKRVLVVLSWNEDPTARHIDISDMSNVIGSHNVGFYWRSNGYYTVTHWRRLPELPKE